jgi:ribosome-binding factor A
MNRRRGKRQGDELIPELAEPARAVPRRVRIEREVLEQLIAAFGELSDPRLTGISVTRVAMTDDLRLARVYVRMGVAVANEGADEEAVERALMRGLRAASGRLRRALADLELRFTPELRFHYDKGEEAARRVDELLAEIHESED